MVGTLLTLDRIETDCLALMDFSKNFGIFKVTNSILFRKNANFSLKIYSFGKVDEVCSAPVVSIPTSVMKFKASVLTLLTSDVVVCIAFGSVTF